MGTTKRWLQLLNRGDWPTEVLLILQYFTDINFRTLITDNSIKGGRLRTFAPKTSHIQILLKL